MFRLYLLLLINVLLSFGSRAQDTARIPSSFRSALDSLCRTKNTPKEIRFKSLSEKEAVVEEYWGIGLYIRNYWLRPSSSQIRRYFVGLGVNDIDAMSGIILVSLHRKLNHKNIKLSEQISRYKIKKRKIERCNNQIKKLANLNYQTLFTLDTVSIKVEVGIKYSLDSTEVCRNAETFDHCPEVWMFNEAKDLAIIALIQKKYEKEKQKYLEVKVLKTNRNDTLLFGTEVNIGKVIEFELEGLIVEKTHCYP